MKDFAFVAQNASKNTPDFCRLFQRFFGRFKPFSGIFRTQKKADPPSGGSAFLSVKKVFLTDRKAILKLPCKFQNLSF